MLIFSLTLLLHGLQQRVARVLSSDRGGRVLAELHARREGGDGALRVKEQVRPLAARDRALPPRGDLSMILSF